MKKGKDSVYPTFNANGFIQKGRYGMKKREQFAAMAMQGLLSDSYIPLNDLSAGDVAKLSVEYADALLAELEKA